MESTTSAAVALTTATAADVDVDLIFVPLFEDEMPGAALPGLDEGTGGMLGRAVESGEFRGRPYQLYLTPLNDQWRAGRVGVIGAGKAREFDTDRLRKLASAAALAARERRVPRIAFLNRHSDAPGEGVQAITEGLVLARFSGDTYKSGERSAPPVEEALVISAHGGAALESALERGLVLGESCNLARELCNEPSNVLTPSIFAGRGEAIAREGGLQVEVLDEQAITSLGMGLLLGVSRGSSEPPRVLVMRHAPAGAPARPVLGLVGKGVTFDTGGISIKPADGMDRMKDDMSGGAAVIGAMRAISLLKAPINVVGVVPMSENMPGGRAIKPGDVLTGAGGKTVEVLNTDAEGRLLLGDGLWYARHLGATHLVDAATLTGAIVVALGKAASGLFGQPDGWVEAVRRTALRAGDRCWPMPLYEDYREQIKSEIADMVNTGGRPAGACTAAMFIREFVDDLPWVHFDIAGTAWAEEPRAWQGKGPTGVAVRTLAELAFTSAEW